MKIIDDQMLLARIRRSYHHVSQKLRVNGKTETRLFEFEEMEKERFPAHYRISFVTGFLVTVKSTGEKYYVAQNIYYGRDDWHLMQEEQE